MSEPGEPTLGAMARSGARWAASAYYVETAVRFGISIALARLLAPADFGTMALAMVFVGFVALVQSARARVTGLGWPSRRRRARSRTPRCCIGSSRRGAVKLPRRSVSAAGAYGRSRAASPRPCFIPVVGALVLSGVSLVRLLTAADVAIRVGDIGFRPLRSRPNIDIDQAGNLRIADFENHRIRRVDAASGIITTVAGTGVAGNDGDGGPAVAARLDNPSDVSSTRRARSGSRISTITPCGA